MLSQQADNKLVKAPDPRVASNAEKMRDSMTEGRDMRYVTGKRAQGRMSWVAKCRVPCRRDDACEMMMLRVSAVVAGAAVAEPECNWC